MITTILLTIYITLGVISVAREYTKPYYNGEFWLIMFILAPYILIADFIYEYKEAKKIENK